MGLVILKMNLLLYPLCCLGDITYINKILLVLSYENLTSDFRHWQEWASKNIFANRDECLSKTTFTNTHTYTHIYMNLVCED